MAQILNEEYPELVLYIQECIDFYEYKYKVLFYSLETRDIADRCFIDMSTEVDEIFNKIKSICDRLTGRCDTQDNVSKENNIADIKSHNCTNCGAPLQSNSFTCEYCGTQYW